MLLRTLFIGTLAVISFGTITLLLLPLMLRPGREAQRALEAVLRPAFESRLITSKERFLDGILSVVQDIRARLHLNPSEQSIRKLAMAGYWNASAPDFYFAAQLFLPMLFAWFGSLLHQNTLFWMVIGATIGYFTPEFWLTGTTRKRRDRIGRSLPDAIDLLVICVDAGLGLDQAVLRVSDELASSHPDLQEELHRMHLEQRAGRPRLETWQNLSARIKLPEVDSLVSLLIQSDRFGTQINKALSNFADDIRQRHRQRVEELAAQAKIKIVFPLVFFIFPCLFIVLLGPAVLSIMHDLQSLIK